MTHDSEDSPSPEGPEASAEDREPVSAWLGESAMARRVAALDWSGTPLGPMADWSETLRTACSLCLHSRFPTALWWGPELIALYNDAYAAYLGAEKHPEALGQPYREVWGEIWDAVEHQFEVLLEEGTASWQEDRRLTVNRSGYDEEAFFTYDLSPVVAGDGRIAGALNVVVETTATVLANRRLVALQQTAVASRGTETAEEAGAAIALELSRHTADLPFALLYLLGGEEARLIGAAHVRPGSEAAPEVISLDDDRWPLELAMESGEPVRVDGLTDRFELPGGPWPEPAEQALVVPLRRGDLSGVLIAGVSPRRQLDRSYHRFLTSLGQAAAITMADVVAREGEKRARLEAERANRSKSEFLTAMSHELRTPLNAIAGYVDLLDAGVHGEPTDDQRQALDRITANQRHLLTLINDILLFARIEAGRLEFRREKLEATELVESLEALLHPLAVRKDIDYGIECETPVLVEGDRERIRQILLNLASNAIKFTPRGGQIEVGCGPTPGGQVAFHVRDTGPGIPVDRQEEIFDPFTQVERRLDSPQEGAGLGLPISRDMARAMGGDVEVESEPGQGATFILTLPRAP